MRYVMYAFRTGHCRLEAITPDRPAELIVAELLATWGSRGRISLVADVTEKVGPGWEPIGFFRR